LQVASFAEGEELVESYCRQRGMPLDDRISLSKFNKVEPLNFRTETHLYTERPSLVAFPMPTSVNTRATPYSEFKPELSTHHPTLLSSYHPTLHHVQAVSSSQVSTHRPLLRSSINGNAKINFVFSTAANSLMVSDNRVSAAPPPVLPQRQQEV
jgi:hypothetical protein